MTTYNSYGSYEEAKIANPDSEIVTTGDNWDGDSDLIGKFEVLNTSEVGAHCIGDIGWVKCNPADHCMTVEQFLKAGHKFVEGDVVLNLAGYVDKVRLDLSWNEISETDNSMYILRAAALEDGKPNQYESVAEDLPKKRVKVEYVKVEDSIFDLKEEFERGGLFNSKNAKLPIDDLEHLAAMFVNGTLYRRIETEIDDREEFIDEAFKVYSDAQNNGNQSIKNIISAMFDSGKFKLVD